MDQNPSTTGNGAPGACKCPHHVMVPVWIALIGLSFLLKALGVLSEQVNNTVWPVLLILIALQKMFGKKCKCCGNGGKGCC